MKRLTNNQTAEGQTQSRLALAAGLVLSCICLLSTVELCAQTPAASPPATVDTSSDDVPATDDALNNRAPPVAGSIDEVAPEIYYIPDANGNLRTALLNEITFEEFKKLLGELAVRTEAPPLYSLNSVSLTGKERPNDIEVAVDIAIENRHESDDAWIRIPLKMSDAVMPLKDSVVYQGPGQLFLQYDDRTPGYVAWLKGGVGKEHRVTLNILVPIQRLGGESRIRLNVPRATKSAFHLTVAGKNLVASLLSGGHLEPPITTGGQTTFSVDGVAGDFRLAWHKLPNRATSRRQALDVEGRQLVQVEGGQVRAEVDLTVQSFVRPFDQFRVQLPPGARLVSDGQAGYSLVTAEPEGADGPQRPAHQWVDVKLDRTTKGPVDIRLVTQQIRDPGRPSDRLQLAGFDVENAIRQSGYIAVQVYGDWRLRWIEEFENRFDIRRVDALPEALSKTDVVARFEYYRQPYSLTARIEPPTTQVTVDPEYVLHVSDDEVVMDAKLKYHVRGAGIFDVAIDMPGWEVLPGAVGPVELVDLDGLQVDPLGRLDIPLVRSGKGELEISIRARRSVDPAVLEQKFPLPKPLADSVGVTAVIIGVDGNVELVARDTTNLQSTPPPVGHLLPGQQRPLYYLFDRGEDVPAELVASFRVLPLAITASSASRIRVSRRAINVRQSLVFDISHQRIESLKLNVPQDLIGRAGLISRDGELLDIEIIDESDEGPTVLARVPLERVVGRLQLDVEYLLIPDKFTSGALQSLDVPLIMPGEGTLTSNQLTVVNQEGIRTEPLDEKWTRVERLDTGIPSGGSVAGDEEAHFESSSASDALVLLAGLTERPTNGSLLVRQAWIQTWLTASTRYDRGVFRFEGRKEFVELELPDDADAAKTEFVLDGVRVRPSLRPDGPLRIELDRANTDHVLELRYTIPRASANWGGMQLSMPTFSAGAELQQPLFWQLILPPQEHLVSGPVDATPWYSWRWARIGWHRIPLNNEYELAQWSGATGDLNLPNSATRGTLSNGANVYLFRLPKLSNRLGVETLPRSLVVLVPASIVLFGGLLLIYLPSVRRAGVLFVAALGILVIGWIYPEPGLIMAQVAILGFVLTLLAVFLRRVLRSEKPKQLIIRRGSGSSARYSTTEVFQPPVVGSSVGTVHSTVTSPPTLGRSVTGPEP